MVLELRTPPKSSSVKPGSILGYHTYPDMMQVTGVVTAVTECPDDLFNPLLEISGEFGRDRRRLTDTFYPPYYRSLPKPVPPKPHFFNVIIQDRKYYMGDPLVEGEQCITHARLARWTTQSEVRRLKNLRKRRRKSKRVPWKYDEPPATKIEQKLRNQCEHLYYSAMEECIPPMLLKEFDWTIFWTAYSLLPHIATIVAREKTAMQVGGYI